MIGWRVRQWSSSWREQLYCLEYQVYAAGTEEQQQYVNM